MGIKLKVNKLHPEAKLPIYATDGAACFDLHANLPYHTMPEIIGHSSVIPTGLSVEIPEGFAMLIYSRSGHGFKNSTRLANCVGIIDSDYRGEIMVKLYRDANPNEALQVVHGDRIAQAMLIPVPKVDFVETDELTETNRGKEGFGSTGSK